MVCLRKRSMASSTLVTMTDAAGSSNDHVYEKLQLKQSSTLIQVVALEGFVNERDDSGFVQEYNKLSQTEMSSSVVSSRPENKDKNRSKNIRPYDHNRVVLDTDSDNPSDYINASHISGHSGNSYVACQGPLKTTVSQMWRMIWQLNTNRIVMLTQLEEKGMVKCDIYWPLIIGTQKVYDNVTVTTLSCDTYADYIIRTFRITCQGESRSVFHFQFTSWLNKQVPVYTYPLLAFRRLIRSFDDQSTGPMVVHCSGGVGQTGTFIALDSLLDQGHTEGHVDVFRCVERTRTERVNMVQTQDQYVFLYHALLDGLQTGHLAYPVSQFHSLCKILCEDDVNLTQLREQFQMLEKLKPPRPAPSCAALQKTNQAKNKNLDIIPDDKNRPHLLTKYPGTNDYINAVFVDSYRRYRGYLLTQMPLSNTAVDLWRLILDHRCPTIILLDQMDTQNAPYWPREGEKKTFGCLTVELLSEQPCSVPGVIKRELRVYITAKANYSHGVKQYQLAVGWPNTDRLPTDTTTFLSLVELVNLQLSNEVNTGPVILQCTNGASRSGLFCAASHLLGSLTVDHYVDVFHSTQHVRNKRPQVIDSVVRLS
ncbi:hypothetical protein NP493_37g04020 [Ridgeia piscesae]|uniref:protein-tyrosine-phosphatase n=1 Tax=Ridgeia piscesae TaxID=27915 RepID=A0AAD9PCE4_RIDPI|nr:hypothetical protein NP493_37g04020 [Ridgeia piscesae]